MLKKLIGRMSIFELVIISLMAAVGVAIKSVIVPLVHIITGPLYIPGGVVAGGIYMLFIVLSTSITGRLGASTLTGLVQGILVIITGISGSHGIMSLLTYTAPGLAVDFVMLITRHRGRCILCCFLGCIAANLTGTLLVGSVFFNMPMIPLLLSLTASALSAGIGGVIAWNITKQLKRIGIISWEVDKNEET